MREPNRPQVLFVCVHTAGRSQMAAALLQHHAAGRVDARSAGSTPADEINPAVRAAMTEIGIDLVNARNASTAPSRSFGTAFACPDSTARAAASASTVSFLPRRRRLAR